MRAELPTWAPKSKPQELALSCPAKMMLFGGAAGSLKSETLLVDACAERNNPNLRAILFRRSYPELEKSLIRRSHELYKALGARYNEQKKVWRFPSGAIVEFGYLTDENDKYKYQGAEYSFIGFDESTHFRESEIRYLVSRLRSTDSSLFLRMRLATNPGNIGHVFHREMFLGPACPHCMAKEKRTMPGMRQPGKLYGDAWWPSDKRSLGMTTAFVPGRITDHSLLPPEYLKTLEGLPSAYRQALLEGCWSAHEGQFFDCWDPSRMVVPRMDIAEAPWWNFWAGVDYGFGGSAAAAYLFAKTPRTETHQDGLVYVLEELVEHHKKAADFAVELRNSFGAPRAREAGAGRVVKSWFLSPDAWANRGEDHSLADQMTLASGIGFEPAANDRRGGAMLLYTMLDQGKLVIADSCIKLIESLATRQHDKNKPGDVLKVSDDELDDCFDSVRYGCYSYLGPSRKTREQQVMESLGQITDPTALAMAALRARAELTPKALRYLGPRERSRSSFLQ